MPSKEKNDYRDKREKRSGLNDQTNIFTMKYNKETA